MGIVFSRFYDKPSTRDTLERIEQEIQNIEERRWDKIKREQFVVQILSFIPITILIATTCYLVYPSDSSLRDKLLLCIPVIVFNLILWICRRSMQWYSKWSLDNEEARMRKLHKEKKKILDMVCETESYRVAAELLEKYDPKQLRRRERVHERPTSPANTSLTKFSASPKQPSVAPNHQTSMLHNQSQQQLNAMSFLNHSFNLPAPVIQPSPAAPPPTPITKPMKSSNLSKPSVTTKNSHNTSVVSPTVAASSVQGRPVRPVLSKDRSIFERLVDWVLADGPENRFALICRYCYGHNGMSLAEEFETINFRCCYCYNLNTTTNKRQIYDQLQPEREKSEKDAGRVRETKTDVVESHRSSEKVISDLNSDLDDQEEQEGSSRGEEGSTNNNSSNNRDDLKENGPNRGDELKQMDSNGRD